MLKDFDLTDRKVLITGAGRGIGKGIALAMAEAGADIGITSLGGTTAEQVASEVQALGRKSFGLAWPVTFQRPRRAVSAYPGLDRRPCCILR
jgi:meso-butanediol dehydrogenase / (S,S)-butanediol dehydrogenase / diacetyl reductase